jgi:tetratricopeptide (TPR) repeat protein
MTKMDSVLSHPASWCPDDTKQAWRDAIALDEKFALSHPAAILLAEPDEKTALERKTMGNEYFSKSMFLEAFDEYTEAIDFAPLTRDFDKHRSIFYCNRAACCLELGRNEEAVQDCTKALELDSKYVKALIRRSRAHEKLDQLEECLADIDAALLVDPSVPGLRADRENMDKKVKEKHEKLKDEMLGKLKEMGNMVLGRFGMSLDNFKMEQDPNTGSYSVNFKQ